MKIPRPIYRILALGSFSPVPEVGFSLTAVTVETPTLGDALTALNPRFWVPVPKEICPDGGLTLQPARIRDFSPDAIIQTTPYLRDLATADELIAARHPRLTPAEIAAQIRSTWPDLPLDLSPAGPRPPAARSADAVADILAMVAVPEGQTPPGGNGGGPQSWREQIGGLLTANMECIFGNREFRTWEAAWRGVECLVRQGGIRPGGPVSLTIIPVSPPTLDVAWANLRGELAADLPDLIIIDCPLDNTPRGMATLNGIGNGAAGLLTPTATWITPEFFHLSTWRELQRLAYLKHHLEDAAYAKWRQLRKEAAGDWLVVTCNRFLTRPPYGKDNPPRTVTFSEAEPLWISPVWALGALAAQSVNHFGWPTRLTDYMQIRLTDLALAGPQQESSLSDRAVTETIFSEERLRQFGEIGMTTLTGAADRDAACLPRAAVASGASLPARMFFSRIIGFLIRMRNVYDREGGGEDPAAYVSAALTAFFAATGKEPPGDLRVETVAAAEEDRQDLSITFTPPASVSPDTRCLAFTFTW
ncbi:MAG TPA: type VI secretion system contractile sheath large subunit [Syntrophales bacterium]|nr:type VI secretion system contractile sheath large subunit [Syntrophales bacterium]HRU88757.1 type VI secretion system contractile sheath large subunit [Syntrophales bacterium]